jgi:hypothetical protein
MGEPLEAAQFPDADAFCPALREAIFAATEKAQRGLDPAGNEGG